MKKIDDWPYRKVKTAMGHKLWVRMTPDEIVEREIYRLLVAMIPLLFVWIGAWAGGMI